MYNCSLSDILVTTESIWAYWVSDPTSDVIAAPKTAPTHAYPKLADVVARPTFSATARVAEAIEERLEEQRRTRVVMWGNEGTSDLSMFAAYFDQVPPGGARHERAERRAGPFRGCVRVAPAARASFAAAFRRPPVAPFSRAGGAPKWINGFAGAEDANGRRAVRAEAARVVLGRLGPGPRRTRQQQHRGDGAADDILERAYPGLIDERLAHAGNGVFRYDKNVPFGTETLRPAGARDRDAVAAAFGEEWVRRFKLTVALCYGTPARLHALMSSFRDMRPYLAHAFRLKRFWHAGELDTGDVDIQRWARAERRRRPPGPPGARAALRGRGRVRGGRGARGDGSASHDCTC